MKLFSQRQGLKPARLDLQTKGMEVALRNKIWNVLQIHYWNDVYSDELGSASNAETRLYLQRLWHDYFGDLLDTLPMTWHGAYPILRKYFLNCEWNEVYDFVEFTARSHPHKSRNEGFRAGCNLVLEEELSGFRFVGTEIAPITSEEEITAIEQAQQATSNLPSVLTHLHTSLCLLSDRKQPDFRNSIKESISAVESICRLATQNPRATLAEALKTLAPRIPIHPALSGAFEKLYGYTSDADGIRHALSDEPSLELEDALFMLVSCSAFINYLIAKCARARVKL